MLKHPRERLTGIRVGVFVGRTLKNEWATENVVVFQLFRSYPPKLYAKAGHPIEDLILVQDERWRRE